MHEGLVQHADPVLSWFLFLFLGFMVFLGPVLGVPVPCFGESVSGSWMVPGPGFSVLLLSCIFSFLIPVSSSWSVVDCRHPPLKFLFRHTLHWCGTFVRPLYCIVMCCTVLYRIIPYRVDRIVSKHVALYHIVLSCIVLHNITSHYIMPWGTAASKRLASP